MLCLCLICRIGTKSHKIQQSCANIQLKLCAANAMNGPETISHDTTPAVHIPYTSNRPALPAERNPVSRPDHSDAPYTVKSIGTPAMHSKCVRVIQTQLNDNECKRDAQVLGMVTLPRQHPKIDKTPFDLALCSQSPNFLDDKLDNHFVHKVPNSLMTNWTIHWIHI